jgi:hypothetical protein
MKTTVNMLLVFMVLSLFRGCATMKTLPASERTRAVGGSFDAVFDGILKYCSEQGFSIKKTERTSGVIETDMKIINEIPDRSRLKLSFTIHFVNPKITEVIVLISVEEESSGGLWTQADFSEDVARARYARTFKEMEKYVVK